MRNLTRSRSLGLLALGIGVIMFCPRWSLSSADNRLATKPGQLILHGVHFEGKTSKLDDGSKAVLDEAVQVLKADPGMNVWVGHRPDQPDPERCELSSRQSNVVANYIKNHGVAGNRLVLCQNDH